jgi:hypothetical protein
LSGRPDLRVDHTAFGFAVDDNAAGLLLLGHDALEIDMKQSVLEVGASDLDVLGQLEAPLEGAVSDALVKIVFTGRVSFSPRACPAPRARFP